MRQGNQFDPGVHYQGGINTYSPPTMMDDLSMVMREMGPKGVDLVAGSGIPLAMMMSQNPFAGKWKRYFNPEDTDLPLYNNIMEDPLYHNAKKGRTVSIEMMSPYKYLAGSGKIHSKQTGRMILGSDERDSVFVENLNKMLRDAKSGAKFPMPVLDFKDMEQEGRHRAVMAERLGLEDIPVLVIKPKD